MVAHQLSLMFLRREKLADSCGQWLLKIFSLVGMWQPNLSKEMSTSSESQLSINMAKENLYSLRLNSEPIVAQYPFKVPGPPGTPFVTLSTKDSMEVQWNEPVSDGGSKIIGYHLG